ncbi:MAG: hypothetical protein H0T60_18930 [Acidobacteria bacterium]|nr:hypothetical protein [Acidobacteriota bacterium]
MGELPAGAVFVSPRVRRSVELVLLSARSGAELKSRFGKLAPFRRPRARQGDCAAFAAGLRFRT